ncbi:MAG: hypothetical protein ABFS86_04240 [Planctomycetota bacterium]
MRTVRLIAVVVFAALLSPTAFADVVHLTDGGTIEGEIVSDDGKIVVVKTRFGEVKVDRARVKSIEKKKTPSQVHDERVKALAPDDAAGRWELALYCREHGLKKQEKALTAEVLALEPQHDGANESVGNVKWDGRWVTPEEKKELEADSEAAEKRAQGLVRYKDRWVTPEEKENLEKGLVKHDGKWMTPDEVKIAQGYVKHNGEWIRKEDLERRQIVDFYEGIMEREVNVALTKHFAVVGTYEEAELDQIAQAAEQTFDQFVEIMGVKSPKSMFRGSEVDRTRTRMHVVYSKRAMEYQRLVNALVKRYPEDITEARAALYRKQKGFYLVFPSCAVIGYQMPNTFEQVQASVIHKTSHVMLMKYRYRAGFFPWWLIEGLGTYQEIAALGHCDTYCITEGGYAVQEGETSNKWAGMARWKEVVKQQVNGLSDKSFRKLARSGLNELDFRDLAKCWSFVEWCVSRHKVEFRKLVANLKKKQKFEKAMENAFGKAHEHVEKEWRDYVRSTY